MKCFNCGAELTDETKFCSYCGVKITEQTSKKEEPVEEYVEAEDEVVEDEPIISQNPPQTKTASTSKPTLSDKAKSKFREFWDKLSTFGKLSTVSIALAALLCIIAFLAGRIFAGIIAIVWLAVVVVALLMKKNVIKVPKTWIPLLAVILSFITYRSLF